MTPVVVWPAPSIPRHRCIEDSRPNGYYPIVRVGELPRSVTLIGVTLPGTSPADQPAKKEPGNGAKIAGGILVLLVALGCIGGIAVFAFRGSSGGGSSKAPADRSLEAKSMCETFVKKKLKAPATAKFSEEAAAKVSLTEYTAAGSVDAQNSLGALLRSTFACDMTYDAAKQEWTAKSVSVKQG
jgi:hypothetical protein